MLNLMYSPFVRGIEWVVPVENPESFSLFAVFVNIFIIELFFAVSY